MDRTDFTGRDFLTLMDYTKDEILYILEVSADFKRKLRRREPHAVLVGRTAAMIFEKKSTRTRTSFQAACAHLGIQSFYMRPDEMQLARGEPISDTARVLDRYCDVLFIRTFAQETVEEFAHYMKAPVINALTDLTHPCQGLADLLTIWEHKGRLEGLKLCYTGDIFNVAHTLMVAGSLVGMDVYVAGPEGYAPKPRIWEFAQAQAKKSGVRIVYTHDFDEALRDADIVYANTWHSMGAAELEKEKRAREFAPYRVDAAAMKKAKPDAIFMHCLPAYRGEEMTEEVIEGPQSVVFDQAENRMHTEKALLYLLLD
ncbi:MAG: ornithine carbamoyltransferase [Anaerolineae bacterium]